MPAATPPRVIGLRSDVFNPLDHTSPHHPLPPGSFIAAAATAMPGKKASSVGSPDGKWYDGDEGKWDDDDVDIDEGDNLHDDEGMSDGSEYKPPGGDDDSLFYSSEENKEFERELDEVARVIEYSDPKKALALVFGNENGSTWNKFWNFVKEIHPLLNLPDVTIVTDQDKGQKSAITTIMDKTGHFHCAHHRRGNIIKMCGSKSGTRVYSALWVYNCLVGCRTIEHIKREKDKYMPMMHTKDIQYLNNLADSEQYPASRCAQGHGIYMYHRSTSAAVESMNAANREMRAKTAVDPLNACILVMKLECKRFNKQQAKAWSSDCFLTPRGTVEYKEVFEGIKSKGGGGFSIMAIIAFAKGPFLS